MLNILAQRDFCFEVHQFFASLVRQVESKKHKVNHNMILLHLTVAVQCFLLVVSHSGCVAVGRSGPNPTEHKRLRSGDTDRHSH